MLINIQYGDFLAPVYGHDPDYQCYYCYEVFDADTGERLPRDFSYFGQGWVSPFNHHIALGDPQTTSNLRVVRIGHETEASRRYRQGYDRGFLGRRKAHDSYVLKQPVEWQDGYYQGSKDRRGRP